MNTVFGTGQVIELQLLLPEIRYCEHKKSKELSVCMQVRRARNCDEHKVL
jgi:hypothetical protein